ncbi:MAG TPA: dienelactone hydrolase family protein [Casimicrobiaceae bacterium]|nr:dienelactone hydrolase family protein [Casimicrobiaceae bacterium]
MGQLLNLAAADGFRLQAYRADPPAGGGKPRGGLVIVQEIFGINSHIRNVCDGFAQEGFVAIAPALFDRVQKGVTLGYGPEDIARGRELKAHAKTDHALSDVAAARAAVAPAGSVGIIGYCWGGFITWMAAARLNGFACAVCYYGGGMTEAVDEKPQCPVMAHFGERDAAIPVDGVRRFAQAHPEVEVLLYDAEHGFNCDERKSYDAAAAGLARQRTLDFLRKNIG